MRPREIERSESTFNDGSVENLGNKPNLNNRLRAKLGAVGLSLTSFLYLFTSQGYDYNPNIHYPTTYNLFKATKLLNIQSKAVADENKFEISSWNTEGRLISLCNDSHSDSQKIVDRIRSINSDVMVIIDSGEVIDNHQNVKKLLEDSYYYVYEVDNSSTSNEHSLFLSKTMPTEIESIKFGDRKGVSALVKFGNKTLRIIGIHLDDESESTRLEEVKDLSKAINNYNKGVTTILVGDFNAMHGEDLNSRLINLEPVNNLLKFSSLSILQRTSDMARGATLSYLEDETGMVDIDKRHISTETPKLREYLWLPSVRLIDIDHIYTTPQESERVIKYEVHDDGGADHRAITATFQ